MWNPVFSLRVSPMQIEYVARSICNLYGQQDVCGTGLRVERLRASRMRGNEIQEKEKGEYAVGGIFPLGKGVL